MQRALERALSTNITLCSDRQEIEFLADFPLAFRIKNWGAKEINRYANEQAVRVAEAGSADTIVDAVFNIQASGDTPESAYARGSDPKFWRREATAKLRVYQEAEELKKGVIGKNSDYQYAGASAMEWKQHKDEAFDNFLRTAVLYDSTTAKMIPLSDVVTSDVARLAQYYTFTKGIQGLSEGLRWAMLTITLPGEFHAAPANAKPDHFWNGSTPDEAHKVIGDGWKRLRAFLNKYKIKLSGVRTEEPMADGTPHWHCAFFYKTEEELNHICRGVLTQFPAGLRVRHSKVEEKKLVFSVQQYDSLIDYDAGIFHSNVKKGAQCQLDLGAAKESGDASSPAASFASYILKYIAKSLGVHGKKSEVHDSSSIAQSGPIERVIAHRKTYGIRSIQFFGIPRGAITGWQALRRVRLATASNLEPNEKIKLVPPMIAILAGICQQGKGAGIVEFLKSIGGLSSSPVQAKYKISILNAASLNSYGEKGTKPVGIKVTCNSSGKTESYVLKDAERSIMSKKAAEAVISAPSMSSDVEWSPAEDSLVPISITVTSENKQLEAIRSCVNSSHYIAAGAGSGKTKVLVDRVLYLLDKEIDPSSIVVTTFTRDAAESLRKRLIETASELTVETQGVLFEEGTETLEAQALQVNIGTMHSLASSWMLEEFKGGFEELLALSAVAGLKNKYLLVDESQDLSKDQWSWIDAHAKTIYAVGDFRQAIYGWRGADSEVYLERLTQFKPLILNTNYRSSAAIVALSNVISNAPVEYQANAVRAGGSVTWRVSLNESEELNSLVDWLEERVEGSTVVLTRSNSERAFVKSSLTLRGLEVDVKTIHSAKGLEWNNVALYCGKRKESDEAEDAREVLYVACTRAKDKLHITSTGALPEILSEALGI